MSTFIAAALAAVLLTGCCSLHQVSTTTEHGQRCYQVGVHCCPTGSIGG